MKISDLRENYTKGSLDKNSVDKDPFVQFKKWLQEAIESECPEPNAMTLATVDQSGIPSARIVLLKQITDTGFVFYTNYGSDKAKEMSVNQNIALVFSWLDLQRQVRIKGTVSKTDRQSSEAYFQSRPRSSQLGAHVSKQSKIIKNRHVLEAKKAQLEKEFEGLDKLPIPEDWGGYLVKVSEIEFWQGRRSRLHDRIRFSKNNKNWEIVRVSP